MLKNKVEYCKVCPHKLLKTVHNYMYMHTYRELVARLRIEGKKLKLAQPSGELKNGLWLCHTFIG